MEIWSKHFQTVMLLLEIDIYLSLCFCVCLCGCGTGMEVRGEPMKSIFSFYWVSRIELRTSFFVEASLSSESLARLLLGIET